MCFAKEIILEPNSVGKVWAAAMSHLSVWIPESCGSRGAKRTAVRDPCTLGTGSLFTMQMAGPTADSRVDVSGTGPGGLHFSQLSM